MCRCSGALISFTTPGFRIEAGVAVPDQTVSDADHRGAPCVIPFSVPISLTQLTTYTKPINPVDSGVVEQRRASSSSAASGAGAFGSSGGGGDEPLPPGMIWCLLLLGVGRVVVLSTLLWRKRERENAVGL